MKKIIEKIIDARFIDGSQAHIKLINFPDIDRTFDCNGDCKFSASRQSYHGIKVVEPRETTSIFYDGEVSQKTAYLISDLKRLLNRSITEKSKKILYSMTSFYRNTSKSFADKLANNSSFPHYQQMLSKYRRKTSR